MAYNLEEEKRCVGLMNAKIGEYFDYVGVSEATKREFLSKANAKKGSGGFTSKWFHNMTIRLHRILQKAIPQWEVGKPNAKEMNQVIHEYLVYVEVSETAKREFASNVNAMEELGAFYSQWFPHVIQSLHDILGVILHWQVITCEAVKMKEAATATHSVMKAK